MFRSKHIYLRRVFFVFLCFCLLNGICAIKILKIQNSSISDVADMQFSKTVVLGETRGYIYDRNLSPLVNCEKNSKYVVLVNPGNKSIIENVLSEDGGELNNGLCVSLDGENNFTEDDYIKKYYSIERYSDNDLCTHITGYINSDGVGVCGIEKAFDKILDDAKGKLSVSFEANGYGAALAGKGLDIQKDNYDSPAGVVLTIDKNIQEITEKAMLESDIECGAAVVINVNTFEIEAICSIPAYKQTDIAASLRNPDLPFVNRAFSAYPVGSVFKPFIAVSAFENGCSFSETYECNGYITVGGNTFRCYNRNIHGELDINMAIEKSCNCFFIETGLKTGAEKIIETAENFGFGKSITFCSTLQSSSGNLSNALSITSQAQLANLCFGQGDLLATPVQLAAAYAVLANGGEYKEPTLLKELVDDNGEVYAYYKSETAYRAAAQDVCDMINTCLYNNMLNGTGMNGAPVNTTSAGKTATAQTGKYDDNGNELLCTWFSGFFPYENPVYAVAVMNEKGSTASSDCAPVFKDIAEGITEYLNDQKVS